MLPSPTHGISSAYAPYEFFYVNLCFKLLSKITGDSACEALRNFEDVTFGILSLLQKKGCLCLDRDVMLITPKEWA